MNFVGHIHLARLHLDRFGLADDATAKGHRLDVAATERPDRLSDQHTGFLIGAALPDFAAIGRFRLTDRPTDESIRAGVELHHRTDDVFHSHRWFRTNSQLVSKRLEREGLPRGAAKACGHVGVELLLDGQLLDETDGLRRAVELATESVDRPVLGLASLVDVARQQDWTEHLASVSGWPLPDDYRSPVAVAERLRRILSRRPRLAFTAEHLDLVARALTDCQPDLESGSAELIDDLDRLLAA